MDYSRGSSGSYSGHDESGVRRQPSPSFASMMMKGNIGNTNQRSASSSTHPSSASTSTGVTYSTEITTAANNFASNVLDTSHTSRRSQNDTAGYHPQNIDGPQLFRRNSEISTASSDKSNPNRANKNALYPTTAETKTARPTAKKTSNKKKNPLRVLGIALIVDQKGTGARMLARYPTSQSSLKKSDDDDEDYEDGTDPRHAGTTEEEEDDDDDEHEDETGDDRKSRSKEDLFFTLTARQMAKLFRTKRSLCNQPMTLRVNKTIFCCHAVLLEDTHNITTSDSSNLRTDEATKSPEANKTKAKEKESKAPPPSATRKDGQPPVAPPATSANTTRDRDAASVSSSAIGSVTGEEDGNDELRLFSVVVALSASTQQAALPFSSFWESGAGNAGGGEDRSDLERYIRYGGMKGADDTDPKNDPNKSNGDKKRWKTKKKREQTAARLSSIFLAIRRVHISLVRFCRALEREETRCGYVTHQSRALFKTRNERQKQWEAMHSNHLRSSSSASVSNTPSTNTNSGGGGGDRSPLPLRHALPRHSRQNSFSSTPGGNSMLSDTSVKKSFDNNDATGEVLGTVEQEQEKEQEILELMLACNPQQDEQQFPSTTETTNQDGELPFLQKQYGNLIRDLVAVFHSLSRNDQEYPPTPSSLLCERDAVVYVNNHFAIPIDAAGLSGSSFSTSFAPIGITSPFQQQHHKHSILHLAEGGPVVVPYYTLLFPHASPSELLQTFHASGSAPPQQLEHLLLTVNPQKPLTQIAIDANLPMHTTIQIASFLVRHGACISSPVVTSRSRLTCLGNESMQRIPELALEFSQAFPGVSLFGVVSFLTTSSRHLGDAMAVLIDTNNEEASWLRESLLASPKYRYYNSHHRLHHGVVRMGNGTEVGDTNGGSDEVRGLFRDETTEAYSPTQEALKRPPSALSVHEWLKDIEESLYAIAVWLLSHGVLIQLQEYMVAVDVNSPSSSASARLVTATMESAGESSSSPVLPHITKATEPTRGNNSSNNNNNDWDENLFHELEGMDYLNGDVSIMALSWRLAIDPRKLRRWGMRHKRIRVISRVPSYGDDWEPPPTSHRSPSEATPATATVPPPPL